MYQTTFNWGFAELLNIPIRTTYNYPFLTTLCYTFYMEITNNNLLNILLPNDNKVIKEALQQADLTQLFNTSSNKPTTTQDILKNLFNDVINGTKSNDTILNLLKNSKVFSDLGNFPKEVQTLLQQLKEVPSLTQFQDKIEKFLLNITSINDKNIQTQINNSGVFLESKLAQATGNLPNTILNLLNEIKQLVQNIQHPKTNEILNSLDKMMNNVNNPNPQELVTNTKELLSNLKQLLQNPPLLPNQNNVTMPLTQLQTLTNSLEQLINKEGLTSPTLGNFPPATTSLLNEIKQLVQTLPHPKANDVLNVLEKLLNSNQLTPQELTTQAKELLSGLKQLLLTSPSTALNQILGQLNSNTTPSSALQQLQTLFNNLEPLVNKNILNNPIFTQPNMAMNILKEDISSDMKALLLQVQNELSTNPSSNTQEILKQVDKLLTQIDFNQLMNVTSHSNFVYLPFLWDLLEDGTIETTKGANEIFYCQINLKLKEYGKLDLLLAIYNKNHIDIIIKAQQNGFKETIQHHLSELTQNLRGVGLIPASIKLLDLKEEDSLENEELQSFHPLPDLNFGINIRV
jgi:hypothetical protein